MVHTHEVVEIFAGPAVEQEFHEVEAAFPGFVAAFVEGGEEVGGLGC